MKLSLSQLEELTKDDPSVSQVQKQVEMKIEQAMGQNNKKVNKQQKESSLQQYTNSKIKNIYKFLENVEQDQQDQNQLIQQQTNVRPIEQIEKEHEYQTKIQQLNGIVQTQKIELDEQAQTIESLKTLLDKSQFKQRESESNFKETLNRRLQEQKAELEVVINRHLTTIEQLMNDKQELTQTAAQLTNELKTIHNQSKKLLEDQRIQFNREIKQKQEQWSIQEKQRRDKWEKDKITELKEQTIKGLEPEIERMVDKHKKDLKRIEEKYQKESELYKIQVAEDYQQKFKLFKEKMLLENEELLQKEREQMTLRHKDMYQKFEKEFEQERERLRKRCNQDIQDSEQRRKEEADSFVKRMRLLQDEQADEIRRIKEDCQRDIDEYRDKYINLENNVKEQLKYEQDAWVKSYMIKSEQEMNKKIKELKNKMEQERNNQIEEIVNRITKEQQQYEQNIQMKYEKRLRDQLSLNEDEIKRLKKEIKILNERDEKDDDEQSQLMKTNKQLQQQITELKQENQILQKDASKQNEQYMKIYEQFNSLKEEQAQQIKALQESQDKEKQKFIEALYKKTEEAKQLKKQMEDNLRELDIRHSQDLEDVEQNVKRVITKKDHEIKKLNQELKIKILTCEKYEEMLKKQRQDLLRDQQQQQ